MRTLAVLLATVAVIYLGVCASLFFYQRSLIYYPQAVMFARGPQITLPVEGAELRISVRPRAGLGAVIYFGGNAEDVSLSVPEIAAAFPDRAIYAMNYRGYGGSSGSPSEQALQRDALALLDRVRASHPDVVVVGRSLGSGIAAALATQRPVARLVLVTPFDSLQELAASQFRWLPVRWLLTDKFESVRHAPRITVPTLLIAAEHDEVIPRASTDRLHAHFTQGVAKFVVLPGVGHNTISTHPLYARMLGGGE